MLELRAAKGLSRPFLADLGTKLFKKREIVTGLLYGLIALTVVRVLAQSVSSPGFKSQSGHVLFPPL